MCAQPYFIFFFKLCVRLCSIRHICQSYCIQNPYYISIVAFDVIVVFPVVDCTDRQRQRQAHEDVQKGVRFSHACFRFSFQRSCYGFKNFFCLWSPSLCMSIAHNTAAFVCVFFTHSSSSVAALYLYCVMLCNVCVCRLGIG